MPCRTRSKPCSPAPQLIAFGTLERHPGLRLLFLESSGGWAPFWLERLDEQAESFGGSAPTWRVARRSTSPASAPSASRSTSAPCPPWCPSSASAASSGAATTTHHDATFPGAVDGHPVHRGPLRHRHPGARARAQRAPALRAPDTAHRAARAPRRLLHRSHRAGDRPRARAVRTRRRLRERGHPAAGARRHLRLLPRQDVHLRGLPARSRGRRPSKAPG